MGIGGFSGTEGGTRCARRGLEEPEPPERGDEEVEELAEDFEDLPSVRRVLGGIDCSAGGVEMC